ncbi:LacI family DNA-binding transcriptional regulator [Ensifer sp. Root127]|uniref:LacI family DNA-binding transcriptional regulator n=1 Tax=Ensifer sp. Root127 TaxID=1736440 RepID=UPI0009E876F0|nr:LacI family DNA-binding transcriptional regulator [Ensifer sp. Root127]
MFDILIYLKPADLNRFNSNLNRFNLNRLIGLRMQRRNTTIKELAKELNLSIGTVSAALNGRSSVRPETRSLVLEAAARIGYVRSYTARSMSEGRSRKLDLVIPAGGQNLSGFTSGILVGADAAAEARGYRLGMNVISTEAALVERVERLAKERAADGFVFFSPGHRDIYAILREENVPHVVVGRPPVAESSLVRIDTDNVRLGREVAEHLVARGRRAPVFLAPRHLTYAEDRFIGLQQIYEEKLRWIDTQPSTSGAEMALAEALNSGISIDAIVTGDDMLALGALHELQRRGCAVPTDVALASTADDIAQYFNPPVTSVALHPEQLGAAAVTVLMDLIECRPLEPVTWINHELKIRSST